MAAYYNEIDPYAAEWLRSLILMGHIADGIVDTRSISEIEPYDLRDFTQCHFFAGIGVWSYALRLAGWPDERPVWTGSCPCQPFSSAGRAGGFADERHLWPHWRHLIRECRPGVIFGEQVASKDGLSWLDLVCADLEGESYAIAPVDICAAGVGAPHIRQRLYFVADNGSAGLAQRFGDRGVFSGAPGGVSGQTVVGGSVHDAVGLADTIDHIGAQADRPTDWTGRRGSAPGQLGDTNSKSTRRDARGAHAAQAEHGAQGCDDHGPGHASGGVCGLADTQRDGSHQAGAHATEQGSDGAGDGVFEQGSEGLRRAPAGPTNGHWQLADWLYCRDGKWRPVEPGTFPLAHGAAARVGRLRAYGNAIVPQAAAQVIGAYMDTQGL